MAGKAKRAAFKAAPKTKKPKKIPAGKGGGKKSNAWRAYIGGGTVSNTPIPW
jgi:hypothetical protein